MMMMGQALREYESKSYTTTSFFALLIYALFALGASIAALYIGSAAEDVENLLKWGFYFIIIVFSIGYIAFDKFLLPQDFTIVHDPQKGLLSRMVPFFASPINIALLTFLVFAPFFFFFVLAENTAFVSYAQYQISETANIFLAGEPASLAESFLLIMFMGFAQFIAMKISRDFLVQFMLRLALTIPVVALLTGYHRFRYGAEETKLFSVAAFFSIEAILLLLFGTIIVLLITHNLNNIIGKMFELLSNDLIFIIAASIYLLVVFVAIFWFGRNLIFSKKKGRRA